MFRDLGAALYAQRTGTADSNTSSEIDRLVAALKDHEAAQAAAAAAEASPDAPPASGPATGGDFKLDD